MAGNVLSLGKIFAKIFRWRLSRKFDAARQTNCAASFPWGISIKHLKHKNARGDCDAAIAKAAAAVTHVQNLSQEVGVGDEGLGLFDFD